MRYRLSVVGLEPYVFCTTSKRDALRIAVRYLRQNDFDGVFILERFLKKSGSWLPLVDRYGFPQFDIVDFHWVSD